jgi:ElaB/YqjD/DUF883 family membrane-anchored ribosome-binding protein
MRNPFKSLENSIKKGINSLGDSIKDSLRSMGRDIESSFRRAGDEVKKGIVSTGSKIEREVTDAGKLVKKNTIDEIENLADRAKNEISDAVKDAESTAKDIGNKAKGLISEALESLSRAITSEGLKKARDLVNSVRSEMEDLRKSDPSVVGLIDSQGFKLKLGPATLSYGKFYSRSEALSEALDQFVNEPPAFRRGPIIKLVEGLGPTEIDLGISVELAFVIGSNELGIGAELTKIPLKLFTKFGDKALSALGVPK